jgi:hypothetical protein
VDFCVPDAQSVVQLASFKREVFLDGPGWLVSPTRTRKSLALAMLDDRGSDQEGDTFNADLTLDGDPLQPGDDFLTYTSVAYSDLAQATLSDICLRTILVPAVRFMQ